MKKMIALCFAAMMLVSVLSGCRSDDIVIPTITVPSITTLPGGNDMKNGTPQETEGIITEGNTGTPAPNVTR